MNMIEVTINNKKILVPEGITILKAAKSAGLEIPTLCYHIDVYKRQKLNRVMVISAARHFFLFSEGIH